MGNVLKIKRGLLSDLSSAGVVAGELKYATDANKLFVGTGSVNKCLNDIIIPVSSFPTSVSDVSTNSFYLLTVDVSPYKAGLFYATISGSAISWHEVGSSVTWANITGNVSDNTALWSLLGNVATLKTDTKNLTGAINELKDLLDSISSGITYKGVVATRSLLPDDPSNGDLYFITNEDNKGVIWNSTTNVWDDFGTTIDISGKVDKTQTIADLPLTGNIKADDLKNAMGLSSLYTYKGNVATVADLSLITVKAIGDAYYVNSEESTYAWNGTSWQSIGQVIDISKYQTKQDDSLTTTAKTVVGAIAELKNDGVGNLIKFVYDSSTYKLKAQLYKSDNTTLISESSEIDLPIEEMIISIEYVSKIPEGDYKDKPGLKITLKNGSVSYAPLDAIIEGMVTETGTQTLTNKTFNADNNTFTNFILNNFKSGVIVTTIGDSESASDSKIATEKAVRVELDKKLDVESDVSHANKFLITDNAGTIIKTDTITIGTIDCGTF